MLGRVFWEEGRIMSPSEPAEAAAPPKAAKPWKFLRVKLADLPLTPEMERDVEDDQQYYLSRGYKRKPRAVSADQVRLNWYFSNCLVVYLDEPDGSRTILAAPWRGDLPDGCVLDLLTPEELSKVGACWPLRLTEDGEPALPLLQ
jgi:hypothetical protein